jgi:hypothetical protein
MRSSSITPALVLVAVFAQHAKTQIVGCDTVKCPSSGCVVGDVTNLDLGIANFTSGISPNNPLTWTVGLADIPHDNSINDTWLKSYYLGTPPNLDLRSMFEISGCALFFETATSVQFNFSAPETSMGTCQDALTTECVDDILTWAVNTTAMLSGGPVPGGSPNETYVCSHLQAILSNNMPASCRPKGLAGGPIVAKGLMGPLIKILAFTDQSSSQN